MSGIQIQCGVKLIIIYQTGSFTVTNVPFGCTLSHVRLFAALWTVARPAPLSTEFFRQGYWSGLEGMKNGLPYHLQEIFPTQGLNPCLASPAAAGEFFTTSTTWEALLSQSHVQLFETP